MMAEECTVCLMGFEEEEDGGGGGPSPQEPVDCPHCDQEACHSCVLAYLTRYLDPNLPLRCLHCFGRWDYTHVRGALGAEVLEPGGALVQREKERLFREVEVGAAQDALAEANKQRRAGIREQIAELSKQQQALATQKRLLRSSLQEQGSELTFRDVLGSCPGCERGSVLRATGACSACGLLCCKECLEPFAEVTGEHKCEESILKSMKHIRSTTRPCPNCNINITHASGCNDMFCTFCGTFWNWRTGLSADPMNHSENPEFDTWIIRHQERKGEYHPEDSDFRDMDAPISFPVSEQDLRTSHHHQRAVWGMQIRVLASRFHSKLHALQMGEIMVAIEAVLCHSEEREEGHQRRRVAQSKRMRGRRDKCADDAEFTEHLYKLELRMQLERDEITIITCFARKLLVLLNGVMEKEVPSSGCAVVFYDGTEKLRLDCNVDLLLNARKRKRRVQKAVSETWEWYERPVQKLKKKKKKRVRVGGEGGEGGKKGKKAKLE